MRSVGEGLPDHQVASETTGGTAVAPEATQRHVALSVYLKEHGVGPQKTTRVFIHPRTASVVRVASVSLKKTRGAEKTQGRGADGGPSRPRLGGSRLV